ncbi:hypothetical protein [Bacillus thuringiensis]|nr:hypothetical protein [Bacillus cereus]MDA1769737.1 hypothetical protein [Bacillus cereus]
MQYVYDISEGNILACKKHKWACERFLKDLERTQDDGFWCKKIRGIASNL